jgi:pentafunctional AROM polypeptide
MSAITSPVSESRLDNVRDILKSIVLGSVRVKAYVVSADEKEGGLRNLLNFGHSIGHAFEGILSPQILHGECVSIGMVLEAQLARHLGVLNSAAVSRLTACLKSYQLPLTYKDPIVQARSHRKHCSVDAVMSIMAVDKKNRGKQKRVVLLSSIGSTHEKAASTVMDKDIRLILSSAVEVFPLNLQECHKTCVVPGSKSISNRALVLAALGQGTCRIRNLLHSDDTKVMLKALSDLQCASFEWEENGAVLVVKGNGGQLQACSNPVYLGNAGTASRFLTTVATLAKPSSQTKQTILTGNDRMKQRPQGDLVEALQANGARVNYLEKKGCFPLEIDATGSFEGGEISIEASVSSQFTSSILMCAPYARKPVTLRLLGNVVSNLYVEMTIAMMESFGITVKKSTSDPYTYHVEQGIYKNPSDYLIEADASSATYPLAIAAITGSTCTVSNIGSASLQGDARFAVDVLRPMGCQVEQTSTTTKVTGPTKGKLKPLPEIDMEPMTDAFLTASVLAAVANNPGGSNTTRIVGIANQEVKECDRISAMKDELAKFGVTCRKWRKNGKVDGIEIDGVDINQLRQPNGGIHCYDDHRVAMSFSVLSVATPHPVLIRERECVGKTWPDWWDELARTFGAELRGFDLDTQLKQEEASKTDKQKSIFLIGMRGAGKSTAGAWAANFLGWPFIDLDTKLEKDSRELIADLVKNDLEDFRRRELAVLKEVMTNLPKEHVFACGGGVVESEEARKLLINWQKTGGSVLYLHRDIESIVAYLEADKLRPRLPDDPRRLWARRQPLYQECSNYEYFSRKKAGDSLVAASYDFDHLLLNVTARDQSFAKVKAKDFSYFLSLTVKNVKEILDILPQVAVGHDAIELRVDLLEDPNHELPSPEFVGAQVAYIRGTLRTPIIFTVRSKSQGGRWPDEEFKKAEKLLNLALKMGVEFLDVEVTLPDYFLTSVALRKRNTKIIASHHDPESKLRWNDGSWVFYYNKALQFGDIIKLVGVARNQQDNIDLIEFRQWAAQSHPDTPIIALNMGIEGQLSRIQNPFLTPVTHSALQFKAAPGQLSAKVINTARFYHGVIKPRNWYLFGTPISASKSPALHNAFFTEYGLPHHYALHETSTVDELAEVLASADFGGASVTIPHKLAIRKFLDTEAESARMIGAVNTITVDHSKQSAHGPGYYRTGHNTDYLGMVHVIEAAGAREIAKSAGLVIGTGGTARAAIYALHSLGCSPILILGRTPSNVRALVDAFPGYDVRSISSTAANLGPRIAIGTIPADKPMDENMEKALDSLFQQDKSVQGPRILLDMAYRPRVTSLMQQAQRFGWKTIPGLEALAAQGIYQFQLWTGILPLFDDAKVSYPI